MKHSQPEYNPVLQDLYKRAITEMHAAKQWKNCPKVEWASTYLVHLAKATALVELLESVTVFNVGGGYNQQFCRPLEERLDSFKWLSISN